MVPENGEVKMEVKLQLKMEIEMEMEMDTPILHSNYMGRKARASHLPTNLNSISHTGYHDYRSGPNSKISSAISRNLPI